ncbi:hypothetical protein BUALT_Bualt18G0110300 [Buddleja alternifolia]|uniref:JmjC domain-containing protein n=1 Tax=Buddleja alternifolia TaxID=168488 RepID=A0AAV6WC50_9LAMI|nr:hypothetical protein BUALT_Bualt18G0110300 [Buddleja alternifolia]
MRFFLLSGFSSLPFSDSCRIPIIDYHRHCTNCSYDLCLRCCKDIREASNPSVKEENQIANVELNLLKMFGDWTANSEGSVPCPPKEYGGCGSSLLTLKRIFKMNWVAKLVKTVEEMVMGCKISNSCNPEETGVNNRLFQAANRETDSDAFLYYSSSEDVKNEGVKDFRMHWNRGKPIIIKEVCDASAMTIWDPMVIWRGIKETTEEKKKDPNRNVKAVNCTDGTEVYQSLLLAGIGLISFSFCKVHLAYHVPFHYRCSSNIYQVVFCFCSMSLQISIELEEFMKGYFDGRVDENGQPQLLKLKDWPSPSASEEFLLYQRPDFISKIPLLEFIHSKWGLLNVAAKLPHYSLQNDVGPKIFISYGKVEEIGESDSKDNIHLNMRDMVFLLVHTCEVKLKGLQRKKEIQNGVVQSNTKELCSDPEIHSDNGGLPNLSPDGQDASEANLHSDDYAKKDDLGIEGSNVMEDKFMEKAQAGALWDVFRREDTPKLMEYINMHREDFENADNIINDHVSRPLYDGVVYLDRHHKSKLKEEFGVEPWSFEQHIGEAVFIPAGCPFQVKHLQSSVQLGLDFLSPESLAEAFRLSEEIRGLPNDHDAKLQILEVGKISLYAASSSIKEVQKLVLDPKIGPELGFEDPNLTSLVSQNLENMVKRRQITCT